MPLTTGGLMLFGVVFVMLVAAVAFTERRRALSRPLPNGYSYKSVRGVAVGGFLVAAGLATAIYLQTGSLDNALGLGGVLLGVVAFGSLKGFFSEYQRKRDGAKRVDE